MTTTNNNYSISKVARRKAVGRSLGRDNKPLMMLMPGSNVKRFKELIKAVFALTWSTVKLFKYLEQMYEYEPSRALLMELIRPSLTKDTYDFIKATMYAESASLIMKLERVWLLSVFAGIDKKQNKLIAKTDKALTGKKDKAATIRNRKFGISAEEILLDNVRVAMFRITKTLSSSIN